MTDFTSRPGIRPWEPGESGNPRGRKKGSRNKLNERFLKDLHTDWEQHGIKTLEKVREESPADYLKVVAMLVPKQHEIKVPALEELASLTEKQIRDRLQHAYHTLGLAGPKPVSHALPAPERVGAAGEDEGQDL